MNRRGFLQGLMCSAATVAIGMRLSHGAPKLDLTEENLESELAEYGRRMSEALANSMKQTKESVGARVYYYKSYGRFEVEMIDGREFYSDDGIEWAQS